jgi:hypothetical protein
MPSFIAPSFSYSHFRSVSSAKLSLYFILDAAVPRKDSDNLAETGRRKKTLP